MFAGAARSECVYVNLSLEAYQSEIFSRHTDVDEFRNVKGSKSFMKEWKRTQSVSDL